MIEQLQHLDADLFTMINGVHNVYFDHMMWFVSSKLSWLLLIVAVLLIGFKKGWRQALLLLTAIALTVLIADQLSSGLIKHLVERPRPSHTASLASSIHIVNDYRGGAYGFVSSHAANSLGACLLLCLLLRNALTTFVLLLWTALQCYSRIYLGVHYPGDIAGGLVVGLFAALVVHRLWLMVEQRYFHEDATRLFTVRDARLVTAATTFNVLIIMAMAAVATF